MTNQSVHNDFVGISPETLPALIDRAAAALANARTSAEVLEAHDMAGALYDLVKRRGRMLKARRAHDDVLDGVRSAQGDLLLIEAQAKIRLANEYDEAQARGEVGQSGQRTDLVANGNEVRAATTAEIGLSRKRVHEARQVRDAEAANPGVVRRALDERVAARATPTKATVREAVRKRPAPAPAAEEPQLDAEPKPQDTSPTDEPRGLDVLHAIETARRAIEPLAPSGAMRRLSPQAASSISPETLEAMSRWFAEAAEEWRVWWEPER